MICAMPRASLRSVLLTWRLEHRTNVPRLDADDRQASFRQFTV
jgi:hypothetical protein